MSDTHQRSNACPAKAACRRCRAREAQALMKQLEAGMAAGGRREEHRARVEVHATSIHTMSFVNAVAHIANAEDHHPDLEIGYGYCRIKFNTHAIGGLSENDFICAAKIDALPLSATAAALQSRP